MSIDLHPSLKYLHFLTALERFNGFIHSVGFSVHPRVLEFPPPFAAMQPAAEAPR